MERASGKRNKRSYASILCLVTLKDLESVIGRLFYFGVFGVLKDLIVVTGRGTHSEHGQSLLRPAVLRLLRDEFGLAAETKL